MKRFWDKVDIAGPDECWEWLGGEKGEGYGNFYLNGKMKYAHRVAMMIDGRHPGDKFVLHHCDNRSCVNPNHLFLGTQKDNMQDAVGKERLGKLTREEVEEIRNRYKNEDITQAELGQDYGVTQRHISDVVNGESW